MAAIAYNPFAVIDGVRYVKCGCEWMLDLIHLKDKLVTLQLCSVSNGSPLPDSPLLEYPKQFYVYEDHHRVSVKFYESSFIMNEVDGLFFKLITDEPVAVTCLAFHVCYDVIYMAGYIKSQLMHTNDETDRLHTLYHMLQDQCKTNAIQREVLLVEIERLRDELLSIAAV